MRVRSLVFRGTNSILSLAYNQSSFSVFEKQQKSVAHLLCASDQPDHVLRIVAQLEVEQRTERLLLAAEPSLRHVVVAHLLRRVDT